MSKSYSHNSTNHTSNVTVPDNWETIPCVQYGFADDKGPIRAPKLQTIYDFVPNGAITVSPVYGLTREQYERQDCFDSGYEIKGSTSIATELQNECEANNSVLYPIHIESDVYHKEGPSTLIKWYREFVEEYLDVPFHTCTIYFSGNRSIHVHVPRFVSSEDQRKRLKELAEAYCKEAGAELDCGLYSPKGLLRLPGVKHTNSGLRKVEIQPEWDHSRIFREANESVTGVPDTYVDVLQDVFISQDSLTVDHPQLPVNDPLSLFRVLDSDKTILELSSNNMEIETPLIERKDYPDHPERARKWTQYNAKEFSPYALAIGNSRSVAVLKVKGTPFCRKDVTIGGSSRPIHALVPAYFYGAQGCAGKEFIKDHEHAPLQLSKPDYKKWDYETGSEVVIIGGKSNSSRIFSVTSWQAVVVGHLLTGEDGSRQIALDYLQDEGYDVGKAGSGGKVSTQKNTGMNVSGTPYSRRQKETEAGELQRRAEQEGVETLTHKERARVACRILRLGWEPAWDWFKSQYGSQFKPRVTWEQFRSIIEAYPDYDHIELPPKPV